MTTFLLVFLISSNLLFTAALPSPKNPSSNTGNVKTTSSCKDGIGMVKFEVNNNMKQAESQQPKLQTWRKVDPTMVSKSHAFGVQVKLGTDRTGGLLINSKVLRNGCGKGFGAEMIVHIKGNWAQIMYTQVFKGVASCWGIFGRDWTESFNTNKKGGLEVYNPSFGDVIFGQKGMRSKTDDIFSGESFRCDNKQDNFWHGNNGSGERQATVILRRKKGAKEAGVQTGTSCGTPSFVIKDMYVLL